MLSRRIVRASPFGAATLPSITRRLSLIQQRTFLPESMAGKSKIDEKYPDSDYPKLTPAEDPEMNGGYINPPRIKRQFRDPHADWWDKQERRNFGEPVHEDHDILGMFSPWEYTWITPGKGLFQIGCFIAVLLSVCYGVKLTYPDKVSYPREFEGGLERELGGAGGIRASWTPGHPLSNKMRYDDWDVILFPTGRDAKIPFKEFKVACHVVPDLELAHIHGPVGMPVMTCFVPSLPPGAGFQLSLHCWRRPELSQFTRAYSKHTDLIKFETRVIVDGRQVTSKILERDVKGPHLIATACEFTKTGELDRLRFPHFRRELLFQNHWRPGDDIGRIKIVISEGFPRDSVSAPIERVKNIVAFSFQHAPLEILEKNGIAWPNQSMWGCSPFNPVMPVPPYYLEDGPSSHTHSPGKRSQPLRNIHNRGFPAPAMANTAFQLQGGSDLLGSADLHMGYLDASSLGHASNLGSGSATPCSDPFVDSAYLDWANSLTNEQQGHFWAGQTMWPASARSQQRNTSDTVMPDYVPPQASDPMHVSGPSLDDDPMTLKAPTNTPIGGIAEENQETCFSVPELASLPHDFNSSLARSLLNQPFPLPDHHHNTRGPAAEVKPTDDAAHAFLTQSNNLLHSTGHANSIVAHKAPQPMFGDGASDISGPVSASSRPACGEFGSILASLGCSNDGSSLATPTSSGQAVSSIDSGRIGGDKGNCSSGSGSTATKRPRNFTPASAKAIDQEDEPRRMSPYVRGAGFGVADLLADVVA
ncbi:hypothetical protein N658DRAFT_519364 [Parathielavia hyrcaniae]|uniref:Uncharacterized protein n=1 Tax=Parathielavia hyrcaniae TaxID=113614 RepID=A0AAN6SX68_9PEZI|nr:hypothetical protein N658DRAFT_519364 [Parathielavia hyrcaniae]